MFEITIDLGLKNSYDSCRKGNISVIGITSRKAHIYAIWYLIDIDQKEKGSDY